MINVFNHNSNHPSGDAGLNDVLYNGAWPAPFSHTIIGFYTEPSVGITCTSCFLQLSYIDHFVCTVNTVMPCPT